MKIMKKIALALLGLVPMFAMAHPGHHHHDANFWTGFMHPFTGLDHLMMAISFGVLMWSVAKQWKVVGALGLMTALVAGFVLGAQHLLPTAVAEYGIIASLLLLAVALWTKSNQILPIAATLLATFHGVAHGAELAMNGNIAVQILGMVAAMAAIYAVGLGLGAFIQRYVPNGKKIIGALAAIVAVIGLA
ncbi:urease accessory protein [Acinetobacter sp. 194]|uniref:HupE/UreJ family protein n=1 Tax=Acinetobacter shaoyimingii TaxID=2715164 RepID=UPI00140D61C1|nr:HupE/UreJ family protein [Acinetobacter shaoyimingii]NHB56564.1 urease accessory protein [Acinetobacter shaoyimingii]